MSEHEDSVGSLLDLIGTSNTESVESEEAPNYFLTPKEEALERVVAMVNTHFQEADFNRKNTEVTWQSSYSSWRGEYSSREKEVLSMIRQNYPQASDIFVRITKLKHSMAYSQIMDVLEAEEKFPLEVVATPVPEGVEEYVHISETPEVKPTDDIIGFNGDGKELPKGATQSTLLGGYLESLKQKYAAVGEYIRSGRSADKNLEPQLSPAELSARRVNKHIQDQLKECVAKEAIAKAVFDMALYGTGVLKFPVVVQEEIPKWEKTEDGKIYTPVIQYKPTVRHVSITDFFPDPYAKELKDCAYVIERHFYSREQLARLLNQPKFNRDAINRLLEYAPTTNENIQGDDSDQHKRDNNTFVDNRYQVLEYWGYLEKDLCELLDIKYSLELEVVPVNIWVCNNQVIKAVVNPYMPMRFPYAACPYERHPNQIFGIGIPENMKDSQAIMNGTMRAAADNIKLAGSLMWEVNTQDLAPGTDSTIEPNKVWYRDGGAPGQSIFAFKTPSTVQENLSMFAQARSLCDEETGIYSITHGNTGVAPNNRTAAGVSMIMNASSQSIKQVIRNIDHYILEPLGQAFFHWNMQFNDDLEIQGDLKVIAYGAKSSMVKEIKTQRLMQFAQTLANENFAPFINFGGLVEEIAKELEIDVEKIINSPAEVRAYMLEKQANEAATRNAGEAELSQGEAQMGRSGGSPKIPRGQDSSGGTTGNIGTSAVPMPGQTGFTG